VASAFSVASMWSFASVLSGFAARSVRTMNDPRALKGAGRG
jgi:hypothetical protein